MKNDRLGLVMIAASLLAIAAVSGLAYRRQANEYADNMRVRGVALTRAISGMDYGHSLLQGESGEEAASVLRSLVRAQNSADLSYLVLDDGKGQRIHEIVAPSGIVPTVDLPTEPYAWYGELDIPSPADGRPLREFRAPLVSDGELRGFVRAGYFLDESATLPAHLSSFAMLALPIFLLTAVSYLLIRREIAPLGRLGERMGALESVCGMDSAQLVPASKYDEFLQRFERFISLVQARVETLNSESLASRTAARLTSYKQEKAESALNCLPDAVLVIDDNGLVTFANQKIEAMLGLSRETIVGRSPAEWCASEDVAAFLLRHKNAAASLPTATLEFVPGHLPDRRASVAAFPLFAPRDRTYLFGMLFVFRDCTQEHHAKQVSMDFVSHVSHELKTPLNALLGYSELLLHRVTLNEAEQINAVNVIRSETERMAELINNLLSITKMESGTLKPERTRVRLHDLLQDAFASLRNSALGRDIELEMLVPPDLGSVRLDKNLFRIAMDNLLGNAIKYSNPGGKVTVSASTLDDGQIQIRVRDRGIGIALEDQASIFGKYFRSSGHDAAQRTGHGLGLYLAKQIIELHQGTIEVDSEPGTGSEFTVTLRAQPLQLEMAEAV